MNDTVYFDKYDGQGSYHWAECDNRLRNWKRYNPALDARYDITVQAVLNLRRRGNLLDVGCGDGMLMARLAEHMDFITGVDSERTAIRYASDKLGKLSNCKALHISCYTLPFPAASFDVVTSADVIEHLKDADDHLQQICRVLSKEGTLVLTTPKWRPDRKWDTRHEKEYRAKELEETLSAHFNSVNLRFFWPLRWSRFYETKLGWRLLKVSALAGWNPFSRVGENERNFGQILAVCSNRTNSN